MDNQKKKYFIIGAICLMVLLNIVWTVLQNKFTPRLDEFKTEMKNFEQRIAKLEQGGLPDVADIREEFGSLKKLSQQYSGQLESLIKIEEDKLKALQEQTEAQKSRLEAIKNLLPKE